MAACGQAMTHLLHWVQLTGCHAGISSARLRFSHFAVAVGQVPSTGNALTGSASPLPESITAVTLCTKSGALPETTGGRRISEVALAGTRTSCRCTRESATTAEVLVTTSPPSM